MIILMTFLEILEKFAYNDSTLVDQNSNYRGFFSKNYSKVSKNREFHRPISSKYFDLYNLKQA